VLLLAPAAALLAAAFALEPLLANWTQTFMGSAAVFLAQFFPLFLLGALFGKLGSTHRESYFGIVMVAIVGAIIALVAVIALGSAFGSF
jgi:H+/gluconate symporter-like permease